jgi:hypothetical protein
LTRVSWVRSRIGTDFTNFSSNAMNDRYTKVDRKPLGDAIGKLPKLDDG